MERAVQKEYGGKPKVTMEDKDEDTRGEYPGTCNTFRANISTMCPAFQKLLHSMPKSKTQNQAWI